MNDFTFELGKMLGLIWLAAIPIGIGWMFWSGHWAIASVVLCIIGLELWADEAASRTPK